MSNIEQTKCLHRETKSEKKRNFKTLLEFANSATLMTSSTSVKQGKINTAKKGKTNNNNNNKHKAKTEENKDTICGKCKTRGKHTTEKCNAKYCDYCKKFFHNSQNCWFNPQSQNYDPNKQPPQTPGSTSSTTTSGSINFSSTTSQKLQVHSPAHSSDSDSDSEEGLSWTTVDAEVHSKNISSEKSKQIKFGTINTANKTKAPRYLAHLYAHEGSSKPGDFCHI